MGRPSQLFGRARRAVAAIDEFHREIVGAVEKSWDNGQASATRGADTNVQAGFEPTFANVVATRAGIANFAMPALMFDGVEPELSLPECSPAGPTFQSPA